MQIYKIVTEAQWDEWDQADLWHGAPIDIQDGYIHMSTKAQAQATVDLHFTGRGDLILAAFDAKKFGEDLKWEASRGGDLFPHVYRPIRIGEALWAADIAMIDGRPVIGWGGETSE